MTVPGPQRDDNDDQPEQPPIDDPAMGEDEPAENDELEPDVAPAFDPASP